MNKSNPALTIRENVPLAPYTTLDVGGAARFLVEITHEDQIMEALNFAWERGCPLFVLGGGSNILVSDSGFPGLVMQIKLRGLHPLDGDDGEVFAVAAGEEWDSFVHSCVKQRLAGIECLSGIPGTVGGTPIQNVGAYGEEVSEVILSVRVLDRESQTIRELSNADCKFSYRSSIFNTSDRDRYIVLRVAFALRRNGKPRISHQDLQYCFAAKTERPTLNEVRDAVLQIRREKAMILQPGDPDSKSAGSFFKNPILNSEAATRVANEAHKRGLLGKSENMPYLLMPGENVKLSAAWLIECAGFRKGYSRGRVGLSGKHTLAIVNQGGATAQDIVNLACEIQSQVQTLFEIELHPEPVFVGF